MLGDKSLHLFVQLAYLRLPDVEWLFFLAQIVVVLRLQLLELEALEPLLLILLVFLADALNFIILQLFLELVELSLLLLVDGLNLFHLCELAVTSGRFAHALLVLQLAQELVDGVVRGLHR